MVNIIPLDHVDEVPVVELNQHDDVPVVPEPVLVDENKDPKEDEFEDEEDPQEEEDDMEIDIEEDENEPKITYPYEERNPFNPPPPASESELDYDIEVENPIEHKDETVPASVHEVGESFAALFLQEDSDSLLPGLMRRDINSLFGRMAYISRQFVEQGTAVMEKLVEKLGNTKDKVECKKLKKELEEARFSNTFLRMQNERVKRDLYWTRVQAHEIYQEMIHRGFMFEERPNEAINVLIEYETSLVSQSRRSPPDLIMPPKSAPMTQAAIRRIIKDSVDAAIVAEWARQANVMNDASGSGPARGQDSVPAIREYTFAVFMKRNPTVFCGVKGVVKFRRWFEKNESFSKSVNRFNQLALVCPRMVEPERVKVDAYIRGLTDNIKGEVTSSKPADLNEAVRMAHKLMEQKSQARDARILEGKKQKWESL
nr:reverse transcriptase domain-containing protein [Tanacetum cinerariifolium]